jgi:hypothetical protein
LNLVASKDNFAKISHGWYGMIVVEVTIDLISNTLHGTGGRRLPGMIGTCLLNNEERARLVRTAFEYNVYGFWLILRPRSQSGLLNKSLSVAYLSLKGSSRASSGFQRIARPFIYTRLGFKSYM